MLHHSVYIMLCFVIELRSRVLFREKTHWKWNKPFNSVTQKPSGCRVCICDTHQLSSEPGGLWRISGAPGSSSGGKLAEIGGLRSESGCFLWPATKPGLQPQTPGTRPDWKRRKGEVRVRKVSINGRNKASKHIPISVNWTKRQKTMDVIQFFNSKLQEQMEHVCPSYDRLTYKQQKQTTCIVLR